MNVRERAHRDAMRADIASVAARLQEVLGQQLTAYAAGIKDPRAIGRYARNEQAPTDKYATRLRRVYEIVQVLITRETADTVRAWMLGAHPLLGDVPPIELLHRDEHVPVTSAANTDTPAGYLSVVSAAEDFVRSG